MTDVVLINPGASRTIYQNLADDLSAIEPNTWCRMIAGWLVDKGFDVSILDQDAWRWSPEEVAEQVKKLNPRLVAIVVSGQQPSASTQQMTGASLLAKAIQGVTKIMIGNHPSALPERTLREEDVDYVCDGEGPITIAGILNSDPFPQIPGLVWRVTSIVHEVVDYASNGPLVVRNTLAPLIPIDELHGNVWGLLPMSQYRAHTWQCLDGSTRQPYASIYTTLGCPFKCLDGDTLINTIHGDIPIKKLAEKYGDKGVPVYTYDQESAEVFISDSVNIRKYGTDEEMVRVHFDDGTHINCTPEHMFLQFKWGNGKSPFNQWECEAQNLPVGAHVRAMKFEVNHYGYTDVRWGRRDSRRRSRMVMDYMRGRKLERHEQVHHQDGNKSNDLPSNLEYCASAKEHFLNHPEIAERMRTNNPTRNGMSAEWRDNLAAANRGKQRSTESRKRYRDSKLGELNPNYKDGHSVGRPSRTLRAGNHRVVRVEHIADRRDVYCLTVPETGWFFANNVLVKNCSFCCINVFQHSSTYRRRTPSKVVEQVKHLYQMYGVKTFKIADEMFVLDPSHYLPICEGLAALPFAAELNIWAYARIDTVKPETLSLMRRAGIRWLALGIESGSAHVRDGAIKSLDDNDIRNVVKAIQDAGINVIGNFIYGLSDDTAESMQTTLRLSKELNCEFANYYSAMPYPGSRLFDETEPKDLPKHWSGYSQHSADTTPLPTKTLTSREVLQFRDDAFHSYYEDERYLSMIGNKFGPKAVEHIQKMTATRLGRAA